MILSKLGLTQVMTLFSSVYSRLAMRAHDSAPRRDPSIKKALHYRFLIDTVRQSHAVALPIGTRPFRLNRQTQTFDIS